jgi:uncharacterized protein (DUF305 family)
MLISANAVVAVLLLSSCGSPRSEERTDRQPFGPPAITSAPAGFNAQDLSFAANMVTHHQREVQISRLVDEHSTNPLVGQAAANIIAELPPEIETMKVLLVQWREDPDSQVGTGVAGPRQTAVDDDPTAQLNSLTGPEFDSLWLQSMIRHHHAAIAIGKAEVNGGHNIDAVRLARRIIDVEQAEIVRMQQISTQHGSR